MRDLAVLIPTRGRPANIRKVLSAWDFTNAWDDADMVLIIDSDDPEIEGYLSIIEETRNPDTGGVPIKVVEMSTWTPMVHKLDLAAKNLAGGWFALGFAGDDHLPQTIGWAKTYLAQLHEMGTGLVYGDDGFQGRNLCSEWAMTSDVVLALGRMIPSPVEHMYSDVALLDLMDAAGAARHLPQVRIEHMHPIVKKAENDEQYRRVNSREQFKSDEALYNRWRRDQMPADLAAVRALRAGRAPEPGARVRPKPTTTRSRPVQHRSGPTIRRKVKPMTTNFPFSREFKEVRGATPDEIGMTLADFAIRVPADQEIVELGVFQGRTALIMAWGAKQGHGAHVTGIDAWDLEGNTYGPPFNSVDSQNWAEYRIRELGYADRITLVKNFASDAAAVWKDPLGQISRLKIGLLFVDDDHDYSGARRAVEDWAPHLAEGAVIAIDDYGHPDWPGVKMAVDDLVAEGVLAPIEIYHERLAVTRLLAAPSGLYVPRCSEPDHDHTTSSCRGPMAITSEGVSPLPYEVTESSLLQISRVEEGNWVEPDADGFTDGSHGGSPNESSDLSQVDTGVSTWRDQVQPDELAGVAAGTAIGELTIPQLKILARRRNIVLGARKDKRDDILQALRDGR